MNPRQKVDLMETVYAADVFVCRDRHGFWVYFSELEDKRWIVEYDPFFRYEMPDVLVIGPFGVRERLPMSAPLSNIGRVLLSVTEEPVASASQVAELAALVSANAVTLSSIETILSLPWPLMEDVQYEVIGDAGAVSMIGTVEVYDEEDMFRLDTGDSFPLESVRERLWPVGSRIAPP